MSLTTSNLLTISQSRISFFLKTPHIKNPSLSSPSTFTPFTKIQLFKSQFPNSSFYTYNSPIRAFQSDNLHIHNNQQQEQEDIIWGFDYDAFLSIGEFLCLASSVFISLGIVFNSQKPILVWLGTKVSVVQFLLLTGGLFIGATIRRRQWMRICTKTGSSGVNVIERIEKLEEDLRSSATIIRVMSRQLEKLGIRFRVTRKALKQPMAEAVALAQKNSEATRALAVQEDILEKELGEMQKVLMSMQEQQEKQLELILAIAENGKLLESRRVPSHKQDTAQKHKPATEPVKQRLPNNQPVPGQKDISNDKSVEFEQQCPECNLPIP